MNQKIEINKELQNAIEMMAPLSKKENFNNLSERIAYMYYLATFLRRFSTHLEQHKNAVCASIVDNSGIDYLATRGTFEKLLNDFENVADHGQLRTYEPDEIEDDEFHRDYSTQELLARDERCFHENSFYKNTGLEGAHKGLLDNSVHLYERIRKEFCGILKMLTNLYEHDLKLPMRVKDQYYVLFQQYEEGKWSTDMELFREEILFQIDGHDAIQERLISYLSIMENDLSALEYKCVHASNPYRHIYDCRKELSEKELQKLFYHLHCNHLCQDCISYFNLIKKPQYTLLFRNKAAEDLVSMVMPTIVKYPGFKHSYQVSAILMACDDLKLTQTLNSRRGAEWVSFVNGFVPMELQLSGVSTCNPYMNKLQNTSFGLLSDDDMGKSKFSKVDFEKLKDVYWFTLTLLNKVLSYSLPSTQFASYLQEEHKHVPLVCDFVFVGDLCPGPDNLFLCRDVLNGKLKDFMNL